MKSTARVVGIAGAFATVLALQASPAVAAQPCDWNTDAGVQACMGGAPFDAGKDGNGDTYDPTDGTGGVLPTITSPHNVLPWNVGDVYKLICNDLDVNGVSVSRVEAIYHVLYVAPYGYSGREAGRAVSLAVRTTCPRHQPAMDEAVRQATSGS